MIGVIVGRSFHPFPWNSAPYQLMVVLRDARLLTSLQSSKATAEKLNLLNSLPSVGGYFVQDVK